MKNIKSGFALLAFVSAMASCAAPEVRMEQVNAYNDSIPTIIPSISTIQTRIDERVSVRLILGSAALYKAPEEKRQQAAIAAGQMALRILGSGLQTGTLILTEDLKNHNENPADAIKTDMKIDSLKKAAGIQ